MSKQDSFVEKLKSLVVENGSYKLVALFVTLILWITIMSRRDFEMTQLVPLEVVTAKGVVAQKISAEKVTLKVEGPRSALRQFQRQDIPLVLDVSGRGTGRLVKRLTPDLIQTPRGVKVLQIEPQFLELNLVERQSSDGSRE